MPSLRFTWRDALVLGVLTLASALGINQYVYGVYNHCITIPFIKSLADPGLYAQDYLVQERQYFYTYFLPGLAWMARYVQASLPGIFLSLYLLSLFATMHSLFLLALRLFRSKEVAYLSVMLLVFSFVIIAMERTIENSLTERTFALPLLLYAIRFFLDEKVRSAAILAGLAFLFHPLSALYVLAMLGLAMLYRWWFEGRRAELLSSLVLIALVASPVLWLKFRNPAPDLHLLHAAEEWLDLLRLRSAHHIFPSEWGLGPILQSIGFALGFVLSWKYRPADDHAHRVVVLCFAAMLMMFAVGTVLTEWYPVSIVVQFQLFRSYKFLVYFYAIYLANYLYREQNTPAGLARKTLLSVLFIAPYLQESLSVIAGLVLLLGSALLGISYLQSRNPQRLRWLLPAQVTFIALLGLYGSINSVPFSVRNAQDPEWLQAQRWARQHTVADAAFIVPPYLEGFRVESERSVYGEWKDGTQMFFNPQFGTEWIRRMEMLGYHPSTPLQDAYAGLEMPQLRQVSDELSGAFSTVYVVMPSQRILTGIPEVYRNEAFTIYEMPTGATAVQQPEDEAAVVG
jgi:hypothetical protein